LNDVFLPLVDTLRCPRPHEETWLVASIDRADERDIIDGVLGCPSCLAEYPVRDGVVYFAENVPHAGYRQPREDEAIRLAAALDLTDARMTAVLHGAWGAHAPILRGISPAQLLLVNPPVGITSGDGISIVCANVAPIARGSANGVAFDALADEGMIASLVASLQSGGRILGPSNVAVPADVTELARDDDIWVAHTPAHGATSAPISLRRRERSAE
jgi:uncharacterized protein YbaR (Trm112 family)